MSHDDDAFIILSVVITPELAECLDRKAEHGAFGSTREEVAQGYLCRAFSVAAPAKQEPEEATVADNHPDNVDQPGTPRDEPQADGDADEQ